MDNNRKTSKNAIALDIFDKFCSSQTLKSISTHFANLCNTLQIQPTNFVDFFPKLKDKLTSQDAREFLLKYEKLSFQKGYERGRACYKSRVLIVGAGPCGLRTAIEAQLLGAKVVLIEKRDRFSRNNVLHLWPFVITDLKRLGAKKFYGKFCAGSIDHISISQIQCILLKVALILGVEFHDEVGFEKLQEPKLQGSCAWTAVVSPADHEVSQYEFDVLIGADGSRNTLEGFKRKALRAKLAIAITANFVNKHTQAEAKVQEISGVSYIFKQSFFQDLCEETAIDLENIVYYKDETHYFVMTAKKHSLLYRGVLLEDYMDTDRLLSPDNIDVKALREYALEAANFSTEYQLPNLEFALNHYGQPDAAIIDFTSMYASENACRVLQRNGHRLLLGLVGDSLLEPFWPTGSGCARGFLSSLDACWMIRNWAKGRRTPLEVISERESVYRLLAQTTHENLTKDFNSYTADPHTRYPNLNVHIVKPFQMKSLYDSDGIGDFDQDEIEVMNETIENRTKTQKTIAERNSDSNADIDVDCIVNWLNTQMKSHGIEINGFEDVFGNGNTLCALLHRYRPDLIPEFPLPAEIEEGIDIHDAAAFRNQLAFDFLHEHYGLSYVVSGFDSIQSMSSHLPRLISYLSKVYEIFKGEIPQRTKITLDPEICDAEENGKCNSENNSPSPTTSLHEQQGNVFRSATLPTFLFGQKSQADKPKKLKVYPKSIQKLVQKLDSGGGCSSSNGTTANSTDSEEEEVPTIVHKATKFPVKRIDSFKEKRMQEAEKAKMEAIHMMEIFKRRKAEFQKEERAAQRERVIKTIRQLEFNRDKVEDVDENVTSMTSDDFFNEHNMRLYRQTVPTISERSKNLESKLNTTGLKMKTTLNGFIQSEAPSEPRLQRPKEITRPIGKIEKDDYIVKLLENRISENTKDDTSIKPVWSGKESRVSFWNKETFTDKQCESLSSRNGITRSASLRVTPSKPIVSFLRPGRRSPEKLLEKRKSFTLTEENTYALKIPIDITNSRNCNVIKAQFGLKSSKSTPHVTAATLKPKQNGTSKTIKPKREKSPDLDESIFNEIDEQELSQLLDWTDRNF